MRYISLFSGIEAASCALDGMGWEAVAFSEIDPFPSAVLAARYPDVPNLGDITKIDWSPYHGSVDLVVGGSPCQSFSIAGGRESLAGESALCFEYWRAVRDIRPRWFLWENVPGVFSTRDNAFGQFLGKMEELGYGMAWRTLDAQFFGVAQRRRRVFLVGCLGEGGASAAVLFEPQSVSGNTQPSREKREELARAAGRGSASGGFKFHQGAGAGGVGYESEQSLTLTADYHNPACLTPWDVQSKRIFDQDGVSPTLQSGSGEGMTIQPCVLAFNPAQITSPQNGNNPQPGDPCQTLDTDSRASVVYALQSDGSTSINSHGSGYQDDGSAYTLNCIDKQSVMCIESAQVAGASSPCQDFSPTLNASHEQPILVMNSTGDDVVGSLCAADGPKGVTGQSVSEGKVICQLVEPIVIDRAAYNQGANAAYPPHIEQTEVMDALVARGPHAIAYSCRAETT